MAYRGRRPLIPVSMATARKSLSRSRTFMHGSSRPHSPCQPNRIGALSPGPEIDAEPLIGPSGNSPFAIAGAATHSIVPATTARSINRLPMLCLPGPGPVDPTFPFHPPYTAGRRTVPPRRPGPAGREPREGPRPRSEPGLGPLGQILRPLLQGAPDLAEHLGRVRRRLAVLTSHRPPECGRRHLDRLVEQRPVDLARHVNLLRLAGSTPWTGVRLPDRYPRATGRSGSLPHSSQDPSYSLTSSTPARLRANSSAEAEMPTPQ